VPRLCSLLQLLTAYPLNLLTGDAGNVRRSMWLFSFLCASSGAKFSSAKIKILCGCYTMLCESRVRK
uniref:Uncharacterized protein n=1 Tax=Aegilops tauschii subsp. strangulata TaxID=200361 RepID=A0A453MFC8_AEGTS